MDLNYFKTRRHYYINYKLIILIIVMITYILIRLMINKINISSIFINTLIKTSTNNHQNIKYQNNLLSSEIFIKNIISNYKEIELTKEVIKEEPNLEPLIYIYNTHQTEEYISDSLSYYNITPTVYMLSNILKKELEALDINSIVEDRKVSDTLTKNNWLYKDSYKVTRLFLEETIKNNPSIKYFIDIHRDSTSQTTNINGITYAKMMFVLGTNHDNYKLNEEIVINLQEYLNNNYPGLMRDILYANKNKFNQDLNKNIILVEIGGNKNNLLEVYNSVLALTQALKNLLEK